MLRSGYEAFARGDMEVVMDLLSDDIQWHIPGRNVLSGDYNGKGEVMGFFGSLMETTGGTYQQKLHDLLANDGHGVALLNTAAERSGQSIEIHDVQVWHIKGGKLTEFWSNPLEQHEVDAFWSE